MYINPYGITDAAKAYRISSYTANGFTGWAYIKASSTQAIYYRISETSPTTATIKVMGYRL